MSAAAWLNTAWMAACATEAWAFRRATRRVAATQARLLAGIVRRNRDTDFGRRHRFDLIRTPAEFQRAVPLTTADDYREDVERIAAGAANVLTAEPVRLLEPTSGTTGGEKLVPYTESLRRQFRRAVAAWVFDLFRHRPAVRRGRAYWSISPAGQKRRVTAGGIPVGFDGDAAYLGTVEQWMLRRLLVTPPASVRHADIATFRFATLASLLAAPDLAFVSVWSPTFLTALLEPLDRGRERLIAALPAGRRREVAAVLRSGEPLPAKVRR